MLVIAAPGTRHTRESSWNRGSSHVFLVKWSGLMPLLAIKNKIKSSLPEDHRPYTCGNLGNAQLRFIADSAGSRSS